MALFLSPGQTHDAKGFDSVFECLSENHSIQNGVMDKAYDSNHGRETLAAQKIKAVIPSKRNRAEVIDYDAELYKQRNKVARFINRLKQFRRIAIRYDKLADTFMAFIPIVAVCIAVS